jgi:hypothetical protein
MHKIADAPWSHAEASPDRIAVRGLILKRAIDPEALSGAGTTARIPIAR